jgi:sugar lactone lactonase YvrE
LTRTVLGGDIQAPLATRDDLGEGPHWDAERAELLRVDITQGLILRFDPATGRETSIAFDPPVGFAIPRDGGGLVIGTQHAVVLVHPDGSNDTIAEVEQELPGNRFNDAKCDPSGRLWAGTMSTTREQGTGALYRITPDGSCDKVLDGLTIGNGLAWNVALDRMYFIDSTTYCVQVFDYDGAAGRITGRRTFAEIEPEQGLPDGMTVDDEDHVWVCLFGGGKILRYAPDGRLVLELPLPVTNPTSACFAGTHLEDLYITSARFLLAPAQLETEPLAGALLRIATGIRGRRSWTFAG